MRGHCTRSRRPGGGGRGTAALKVAREVFRLWGDDGRIKSHYSDHMYEHHLPLLRGTLTTACGRGALELLIDRLRQAVTIEGKSDYSHLSRHPVSHVNIPPFDIGDVLMTTVRRDGRGTRPRSAR